MSSLRSVSSVSLLVFTALAGCGPRGAAPPTTPEATESEPADEGVVVQLGCDAVTQEELDAAYETLPASVREARSRRELDAEITDALVRRTLLQREAIRLHLGPPAPQEIARAVDALRARIPNGQSLEEALRASNTTLDELRQELANQLVETRIVHLLGPTLPARPGEPEVPAQPTADTDEARTAWMQQVLETSAARVDAYFAEQRERLAHVETRSRRGRCVEVFPPLPLASVVFEGNTAIPADALREVLAEAATGGELETDASGGVPFEAYARLIATYYDRGFLDVRIAQHAEEHGLHLQVLEGPQYTFGELVLDAEPPLLERVEARRSEFPLTSGQVFERSRIAPWVQSVRDAIAGADVEGVEFTIDRHGTRADLVVTVR